MLFMSIYSYSPEKRAQVIQRRLEKGAMDPPGSKLLGEWSYAGGGKVFRLHETEDVRNILHVAGAWADLGHIEVYPVLETEEALKLLR
jgi:Domain of unknown function (DUF3303)